MRDIKELASLLPQAFKQMHENVDERNRIAREFWQLSNGWERWPKDGVKKNEVSLRARSIWIVLTDSERREATVQAKEAQAMMKRKNLALWYLDTFLVNRFGKRIQDRMPGWVKGDSRLS